MSTSTEGDSHLSIIVSITKLKSGQAQGSGWSAGNVVHTLTAKSHESGSVCAQQLQEEI